MTFKSIEEYQIYIDQINEEHYEKMTLAGDKEEEFNEMMKIMNEEIEQAKEVPMTPTDADVSEGWNRLRKEPATEAKKEVLHKQRKEVKILECIMQTDSYLGYLAGSKVLAMLNEEPLLAGFYQGKYDKFVAENTPK